MRSFPMPGSTSAPFRALTSPFLVLLALTGLGACAGADDGTGGGEEPGYGGTAVIAGPVTPQNANPLTVTESWTRDLFLHGLFLPLVRTGEDGSYEPALARSWETDGDSVVTFHLREDVRWHDGRPTTAGDVAFTYRRATDPETGFANPGYFSHWSDPEVVDSFTIRFRTRPQLGLMLGWAETPIAPAHLLDSVPSAGLRQADYNRQPVGNGPFRLASVRANDRWVLEANPDFPEELGGRPYLDRVVWRVVPENDAQVTELLTGNAHLITGPRASQLPELDSRDGIRAIVRPTRKYMFIGWNGRLPVLRDPQVRRALALAIDRNRILDAARAGYGVPGATPVPPSHFAFDSTRALPFDTATARDLLDQAGLRDRDDDGFRDTPDGDDFTIVLKMPANNAFNRDVAELIRGDLERVGIRLETRATEGATLIGDIIDPERRFQAVLMGLEADLSLDLRPLFHSDEVDGPFQLAGYSHPAVDATLDSLALTADSTTAVRLWHRLQQRLSDDQPWTLLWYSPDLYAARQELRGTEMDARGAFVHLPRWWLDAPTAPAPADSTASPDPSG